MSTLRVSNIQDTSGGNTSTPAAIANGIAKAWVNFNGTGTIAVRTSYNVSSITDNGVGDYTVTFTSAFSDVDYLFTSAAWQTGRSLANQVEVYERSTVGERTTSALRLSTVQGNTAAYADFDGVFLTFFR